MSEKKKFRLTEIQKGKFEGYLKKMEKSVKYYAGTLSRGTDYEFEDAEQEMWLSCLKSIKKYHKCHGSITTFVVRRMRNTATTLFHRAQTKIQTEIRYETISELDRYGETQSRSQSIEREERAHDSLVLDRIEEHLESKKQESTGDYRALQMFKMMRTGMSISEVARNITYEKLNKKTGKVETTTGMYVSWLSRLFEEKIRRVVPELGLTA